MGNLFGRKKQSRVTEQDKAILVRRRAPRACGRGPGTPGPGRGNRSGAAAAAILASGSVPAGRPAPGRARRPGGFPSPSGAVGFRWGACPGGVPPESERTRSPQVWAIQVR